MNENTYLTQTVFKYLASFPEEEAKNLTIKQLREELEKIKAKQHNNNKKIPRPANSFILYRRDKNYEFLSKGIKMKNNDLSRVLGKSWREESIVVKDYYFRLAQEAVEKHKILYPGYKYKPRKHKEIKRRVVKNEEEKKDIETQTPDENYLPNQDFFLINQNVDMKLQDELQNNEIDYNLLKNENIYYPEYFFDENFNFIFQ